jgi:hypothetical protein
LNGVSLGQAFLATTKSFGNGMPGASSSWTPGQSGNGKVLWVKELVLVLV